MITIANGTEGEDRFYVMALKDIDGETYRWYENGYGKLDETKVVETIENDFGKGRENTQYWIKKLKSETEEDKKLVETDMWKAIQDKLSDRGYEWFVPSKAEWSAFGNMCYTQCSMTNEESSYKQQFGLNTVYWSSSLRSIWSAYYSVFVEGDIHDFSIGENRKCYIRLSTTF